MTYLGTLTLRTCFSLVLCSLVLSASSVAIAADSVVVTDTFHHLGDSDKPDWKGFTTEKPVGKQLSLRFDAWTNRSENTLVLTAGGVSDEWNIVVNGRRLGTLRKDKKGKERPQLLAVPRGVLKRSGNRFVVERAKGKSTDDIWVGDVRVHGRSVAAMKRPSRIAVRVRDEASGRAIPCRITVTYDRGGGESVADFARFEVEERAGIAVRKGIVYSIDGSASLELRTGRYRVWASRGFEYGVASETVDLEPDATQRVDLRLAREVDTTGYLAADTHIHTLTYSKHGNATVAERVVTIAGEGVEVAIATDHNHHTDYREVAKKNGVRGEYRSVVGNEFTTGLGHFNAFPIDPRAKPANHKHDDWEKLLRGLRATPGVRAVICNHPLRGRFAKGPWDTIGLDRISGEVTRTKWLGLDAIEILNGKSLPKDRYETFRDWFALLNRGYRLTAVAGSDSHTVEQPVGQARTYVRCSVDDPRRLKIDEFIENFLAGRVLVSLGLLADVRVDGKHGAGDFATDLPADLEVEIIVTGPAWTRADRVALFLNGSLVREEPIAHASGAIEKLRTTWRVPRPSHDSHLVIVASGPPETPPCWPLEEDDRYVIGATNPVWLDGDGDGAFTSAYAYAQRLVKTHGSEGDALATDLRRYDEAVAIQATDLVRRRLEASLARAVDLLRKRYDRELSAFTDALGKDSRERLGEYIETLPPLEVERDGSAD